MILIYFLIMFKIFFATMMANDRTKLDCIFFASFFVRGSMSGSYGITLTVWSTLCGTEPAFDPVWGPSFFHHVENI